MKNCIILSLLAFASCRAPILPSNLTQQSFPKRVVQASETPFEFVQFTDSTLAKKRWDERSFKKKTLAEIAGKSKTSALLVSRNDTILFEWYDTEISPDSLLATFSLAKSITGALVGLAIADGYIDSVNEPVANYLPSIPFGNNDTLRISHLLTMTSGYSLGELKILYADNHLKTLHKLKVKEEPGEKFVYWSAVTQVMGEVLTEAISPKTLAEYLEEKIWQEAGMQSSLNWRLDKDNVSEKAFCCMEIMAVDMLRFGYLYLNNGFMNGQQIIPEKWVKQSTRVQSVSPNGMSYGYLFWLPTNNSDVFMARGYHGQYLMVNRKTNMMVVRMGTGRKKMGFFGWDKFLEKLIAEDWE